LHEKAILLIKLNKAAGEAVGGAELVGLPAHLFQTAEDLEAVAAIAVADVEPSRALVKFLAKAVSLLLVWLLLLGAGNDVVVVDVSAELFDVVGLGFGAVADAEPGHVAAEPASMHWLRPLWEICCGISRLASFEEVV
jgi:hypothetical protein